MTQHELIAYSAVATKRQCGLAQGTAPLMLTKVDGDRRGVTLQPIDTTTDVETPERVRFRHRLAGPAQRGVAWVVDLCVKAMLIVGTLSILSLTGQIPGFHDVGFGIFLIVLFLLSWWYGAFFETLWQGQTPGKLLLSLRVVRVDGAPATLPDFVLRNLLQGVDFLPMAFGIGTVTMALDERMRRIGDLAAGTVVVVEERTRVLGRLLIEPPITEEERCLLPAGVQLQRIELKVIEDFLRRRHRFSDERAEELASYCAPAITARTEVAGETAVRTLLLTWARATGADR